MVSAISGYLHVFDMFLLQVWYQFPNRLTVESYLNSIRAGVALVAAFIIVFGANQVSCVRGILIGSSRKVLLHDHILLFGRSFWVLVVHFRHP